MRRFQKQQMLNIIADLHIAHQQSRDALLKKEYESIRLSLSDFQQEAIRLGETIEQLEGMGTAAVGYLEEYCEKLYHTSMQIEELTAKKYYKILEETLIKAENEIARMAVRKEIVFLPYKASMWDSLESIYLAAKADENCDAYVVPVPYYERNEDDSLGELHYEGNEFPKNIEITHYETYHLEERHPDAIYIHNPYDNENYVTCLPEKYFCKNLRKCTDQLVYIPYFVLDEIEPDDERRIEGMKHFCFLPGTIFAHKVIVQSEKMRRIYINEYIKAAKEYGFQGEHTDRKKLEEKILGLGSPKIDKVRNTAKEEVEVPEEWLKIIEKPDGTWKKIILYNTSVNAFLQYEEKMFVKIRSIFREFKESQDKAALLWRPHPLISNTLKVLRPHLLPEYERLVEEYRRAGWGIYDDSADIDRAIILSDGYYGDKSSVVQLYQETGKPVMIQDVNIERDEA